MSVSRLSVLVVALLLGSCGAGTAGIVAGSGGSSDGSTPPAITSFSIENPKEPNRATLHFALSKGTTVEWRYGLPSEDTRLMDHAGPNPRMFGPGVHAIPWNFALEPGLEPLPGESFKEDVLVFARIPGVLDAAIEGENAIRLGVGNDEPVVESVTVPLGPDDQVDGIVLAELVVSDTSDDVVTIRAEFNADAPDYPEGSWTLATPSGPGLGQVVAGRSGSSLAFFWDTDVDLMDLERDVRLRFTPEDGVAVGLSSASTGFRVDNNAEPAVVLGGDQLVSNTDERRGIPVPFILRDEESDEVELVFQWRRAGQDFPDLPGSTRAEIEAILADPEARRELHICSEFSRAVTGRLLPVDDLSVRLPELAAKSSFLLTRDLKGRTLDILRPREAIELSSLNWPSNPLLQPIAALPIDDGITALVLDRPAARTWRLSEVDLATGDVLRVVASAAMGDPDAMAWEPGQASVLLASHISDVWRVDRVACESGARDALVVADGSTEGGSVRGIASLGVDAALITVGSSLIRIDYADPISPRRAVLFDDLQTPWGVVLDPLNTNRVYVAEHTATVEFGQGRVLAVELDTRSLTPVLALPVSTNQPAFPRPRAIALERGGARLLVGCDIEPLQGAYAVRAVDMGGPAGNQVFLDEPLPASVSSLATGLDGLRLYALPEKDMLALSGGVEQKRTITNEPVGPLVRVDSAFDPPLSNSRRWRILDGINSIFGSPAGRAGVFVWDSEDVLSGDIFLKAIPIDSELGIADATGAPKHVRSPLDGPALQLGSGGVGQYTVAVAADIDGDGDSDLVATDFVSSTLTVFFRRSPGVFDATPLELGGPGVTKHPQSVAVADLDGDGDLDIVSGNSGRFSEPGGNNLTVFFQLSPGVFDQTPLELGGPGVTDNPQSVAVADLDGDGDLDIVSANGHHFDEPGGDNLTVFFQLSPGAFDPVPLELGDSATTGFPTSVATADLDGDGDLDLVSTNGLSDTLTVFFQTAPGAFDPRPLELGGSDVTDDPVSVVAADLDGDGDVDLASANSRFSASSLTVFLQDSPGNFGVDPLELGTSAVTTSPLSVAAADLDGDGDMDLVSANLQVSHRLTAFFQGSPGDFGVDPLEFGGTTASLTSVTTADLDGDGDLDVIAADQNGSLPIIFQASPGAFDPTPLEVESSAAIDAPQSVAAADIDGDGDLDLVSANAFSDTLKVFFQTSPGAFDPTPLVLDRPAVEDNPWWVEAGDLDGDGDMDLVSANAGSDTLTVFFQEESGSFGAQPLELGNSTVTAGPVSVAMADLDGDGDLDLVSANQTSDTLTIFFQGSPGVFSLTPLVLGGPGSTAGPISVVVSDLDGDGDLDVASANREKGTLVVFFQVSSGTFDPTPLELAVPRGGLLGLQPLVVAVGDLDGDGLIDLVSGNGSFATGATLTIFFQVSPGAFDPTPLEILVPDGSPFRAQPKSLAVADLDGDGDLDLVSGNNVSMNLTVFFQLSPGAFDPTPLVLGGDLVTNPPNQVLAIDLDGDGDSDLVSANGTSDTLTVFWGGR